LGLHIGHKVVIPAPRAGHIPVVYMERLAYAKSLVDKSAPKH
jgi:hypothetical protein